MTALLPLESAPALACNASPVRNREQVPDNRSVPAEFLLIPSLPLVPPDNGGPLFHSRKRAVVAVV